MASKELSLTESVVNLQSPQQLAVFAKTLKQFIVDQNLYTEIQKKNYVNVEGWQFAGAVTGITEIVKTLERLDAAGEIKYRAEIQLVRLDDPEKVVGGGIAICSNKEAKRKTADEYVIASMAQTRAIGKAYRNKFGWLMKIAGYETTPSEEMEPEMVSRDEMPPDYQVLPIEEITMAVSEKLEALEPHERIKTMKRVNKLSTAQFTEQDWRRVYDILNLGRKNASEESTE